MIIEHENVVKGGDGTIATRQPLDERRIAMATYQKLTNQKTWEASPRLLTKLELILADHDIVDPSTVADILKKTGADLWVIYRSAPQSTELVSNCIDGFDNINGEGLIYGQKI